MTEIEQKVWQERHANDSQMNREQLMQDDFHKMTKEREEHLAKIKADVSRRIDIKYRKGQAEHGGNVWERNPLHELDGKITDLNVYFCDLKKRDARINWLCTCIRAGLSAGDTKAAQEYTDEIYNLTYPKI